MDASLDTRRGACLVVRLLDGCCFSLEDVCEATGANDLHDPEASCREIARPDGRLVDILKNRKWTIVTRQ